MPQFKVSLHRRIFRPNERSRNPFLSGMPHDNATHAMLVREWTFEARNKKHVRQLLKEAQDAGYVNVIGYTLRSIEELPNDKMSITLYNSDTVAKLLAIKDAGQS